MSEAPRRTEVAACPAVAAAGGADGGREATIDVGWASGCAPRQDDDERENGQVECVQLVRSSCRRLTRMLTLPR